jgi:uncharacterized protein DUF4279
MNNLTLVLKILDFKFDHSVMTNLLGLTPTAIYKEGEEYLSGPPDRRILKQYKHNYWEYRVHIKKNAEWIQTLINAFAIEVIIRNEKALEEIKNDCEMELFINVVYLRGERLESFHFDTSTLKLFARLNIELDIDQYIFDSLD